MSELVIFDKLGINQEFDKLSVDKQFEFGLSALQATPTILAGLIATAHPCDINTLLKKPIELLVLFEIYFKTPGLAKKVLANTLHCLDGTIPAEVEILSGGADELALAQGNAIDEQILAQNRAAQLALARTRRKAAELVENKIDDLHKSFSGKTRQEIKAVVIGNILSMATLALVYGLSALTVSVAAGVTAGTAGAAVGATEFVTLVATDKAADAASAAVAGASAVAGAAKGAARSVASALLTSFGGEAIAEPVSSPTPLPRPPITVADRASEAMYSAESVTVRGSQLIVKAANTIIFSGMSQQAIFIGAAGFYVLLAVMYYFMWRSYGRKFESASLEQLSQLGSIANAPSPPLDTLMDRRANQMIANAPAPAPMLLPAPPPATAPMLLPAPPPIAATRRGSEQLDEDFETPRPSAGGVNHGRLPSLPTRRGQRSSSSSKRRYTHRQRALRTGKGGYRPTKSGRKA